MSVVPKETGSSLPTLIAVFTLVNFGLLTCSEFTAACPKFELLRCSKFTTASAKFELLRCSKFTTASTTFELLRRSKFTAASTKFELLRCSVFPAASTTFELLKCSKFTAASPWCNPSIHIWICDLQILDTVVIYFVIKPSKSDQLRKGLSVFIFNIDSWLYFLSLLNGL